MSIRESLSPEQRSLDLKHDIDPGFVNHRMIMTVLGPDLMRHINEQIRNLSGLEFIIRLNTNHIYKNAMLLFCEHIGIKNLRDIVAEKQGNMFCSTEFFKPCSEVYDEERVISEWDADESFSETVELHYSTGNIVATTFRERLYEGGRFSVIAAVREYDKENNTIICEPLIMGSPWLSDPDDIANFQETFYGWGYFENFIEDIDEFSKVKEFEVPENHSPMKNVSEWAFKLCVAEILGDQVEKDWGGEMSDYYSAHLHLNRTRITTAFMFKGPSKYRPMRLNELGKNNDQILRLSKEPAQFLIVQHCHDILPAVRETLRVFAAQNPLGLATITRI